jgi:hypothetical protein
MSSNGQFWLGLAFAIPMSIIANLFTPKIQDWLSRRSKAAGEKRKAVRAKEQSRIDDFVKDPIRFNSFLLITVVASTMLGSGIGVFTAVLYMMGTIAEGRLGALIAQAISVFGGLIITKICVDAINIAVKVRDAQKSAG